MDPHIINISFDSGEDFAESFLFCSDSEGLTPMDLTSYVFDADLSASVSRNSVASFTFDTADADTGLIIMELPAAVTATITPMAYNYDVLVTDPDGARDFWIKGTCTVRRAVTRRAPVT